MASHVILGTPSVAYQGSHRFAWWILSGWKTCLLCYQWSWNFRTLFLCVYPCHSYIHTYKLYFILNLRVKFDKLLSLRLSCCCSDLGIIQTFFPAAKAEFRGLLKSPIQIPIKSNCHYHTQYFGIQISHGCFLVQWKKTAVWMRCILGLVLVPSKIARIWPSYRSSRMSRTTILWLDNSSLIQSRRTWIGQDNQHYANLLSNTILGKSIIWHTSTYLLYPEVNCDQRFCFYQPSSLLSHHSHFQV